MGEARVRDAAREHTEQSIQVLATALDDDDARIRIKAAEVLLDRGWGKPPQAIVGGDEDSAPIQAAIRVLFGRD